jgi:hypothetical protein
MVAARCAATMAATVSGTSDPMANKTPASKGYRQ